MSCKICKCFTALEYKNIDNAHKTKKQFPVLRHPSQDVLTLVLYRYEVEGKELPIPSARENIEVHQGEFVNDIRCDTLEYRKMYNNKSVRKNVTLPEWLNEEAEAQKINFSQVLQEALLQKLGRI